MCNTLFDTYESMIGLSPLVPVSLRVNGRQESVSVEPWLTLLDLLRTELQMPGGAAGCRHSDCGQCSVVVDGENVHACLTLAVMHNGSSVHTRAVNRLSPVAPAHHGQPALA